MVQFSHPYMATGKTIALTTQTFVGKVMSLLLNMLSKFVIAFLPRKEGLLISWLQSSSAVIWGPENKVCHCFHCFSSICHEEMGPDAMIFVFWMLTFRAVFSLFSFTFIKRLFSSSSLDRCRKKMNQERWNMILQPPYQCRGRKTGDPPEGQK